MKLVAAIDEECSRPRSWSSPEAELFEQTDELSGDATHAGDDPNAGGEGAISPWALSS